MIRYQREQYFSSFDEFDRFPSGWDTDFSTTSAGPYKVALKQCAMPGVFVNTAWLGSPTLQQASTPKGMRTFALPLHLPGPYCWRGLSVDARTFMAFPSDRELFSMMGADSEILTISVDQRLVDDCLQAWGLNPDLVFEMPRTTQLSEKQYYAMRRNLAVMTEFIMKYGDHRQAPQLSRGLLEFMIENILQPVTDHLEQPRISESAAAKRVQKAADYSLARLGEPITVGDICDHLGCSRRSLEQSFRKYAGTSPKQFLLVMRLEHCRRAFLAAGPDSEVSRIASQHGFWHMGQFAAAYRNLFGETPRQTLRT